MVLLVFLVDTSASMNQRTYLGTSYLDLAKGAVESFLKVRIHMSTFLLNTDSYKNHDKKIVLYLQESDN